MPTPETPRGGKWWATATATIGIFSSLLAATILTVALPRIMADQGIGHDLAQWLITGFLAAMTTTMLLSAWCMQRFGLRATFIGSLAVFCVASVVGAAAPSFGWLVAARVVQGAAAGIIQPLGMVVVYEAFPPHERGKGFGIFGLGVVLAPAVAPVIGGLLVDLLSWRAVFLVALPTTLAAMAMARTGLRGRSHAGPVPKLDVAGLVLLAATMTVGLWALARGPQVGWGDAAVAGGLAASVAGLIAFLVWQWLCTAPLLDLRAFGSAGFVGGFFAAVMIGVGLFASTYLLPLFLQQALGMDASSAGLLLLPGGIGMAAAFPLAGQLTDRAAPAVVALAGLGLFLVSCLMLGGWGLNGIAWLVVAVLIGRVGLGLMMPPISAGALQALPPQLMAQGSGAMNFGRQFGGALGVGLASVVLDAASGSHRDGFAALAPAAQQAAYAEGHHTAFLFLAAAFALTVAPLWLMHRSRRNGG